MRDKIMFLPAFLIFHLLYSYWSLFLEACFTHHYNAYLPPKFENSLCPSLAARLGRRHVEHETVLKTRTSIVLLTSQKEACTWCCWIGRNMLSDEFRKLLLWEAYVLTERAKFGVSLQCRSVAFEHTAIRRQQLIRHSYQSCSRSVFRLGKWACTVWGHGKQAPYRV